MRSREELVRTYDLVAGDYAEAFGDELDHKPYDRELLAWVVETAPEGLPICDLGCGPGHVAAYLRTLGATALGIDLSPRMIEEARRRYPDVDYRVGEIEAPLSAAGLEVLGVDVRPPYETEHSTERIYGIGRKREGGLFRRSRS